MMFNRLHVVLGIIVVVLVAAGLVRRYVPTAAPLPVTVGDASRRELEQDFAHFDQRNFDPATSAAITNAWWPLKPGTRWVYEGFSLQDGERVRHMVVDTVTDLTKEINGVAAAVSLEEDYSDGQLVERELAFHAQDKMGNIWHLGQLREEYEDKQFLGAQAWLVGHLKGAKAGIRMWADPKLGSTASQGYAPSPFYWTDRGRVYQVNQKTNVAAGSYDNVLVVEEWDQETPPDVFQLKYFARGVGVVRVGFRGPDPEREEMELVTVEELSPTARAEARAEALAVEERAYVYGRTPPAQPL